MTAITPRLPNFDPAEIRAAVAEMSAIFSAVQELPTAPPADYTKAYTICMTPRSGSTYLTDVLGKSCAFGHPQEYLHRLEPTALPAHAKRYGSKSWDAYLAALAKNTSSANGVFGVKADPNMLLPMLVDGSFDRTLRHGKFIYITRGDVLMQAISLAKAQRSGAWTEGVRPVATPEFNFGAIYQNVQRLAGVMGQWEAFFALNGISPLRLTYERIDSQISEVLQELGDFLCVPLPASVVVKPKSYQRNAESSAWRSQFLATLHSV